MDTGHNDLVLTPDRINRDNFVDLDRLFAWRGYL